MKRALVLAAAGLCVAAAAHAQNVSKKYGWDDGAKQTCLEPYAPAVPKAEETSLEEMVKEVKPEVQGFIDESGKYLECLSVQIAKARETQDEERLKKLVKAHNDNVDYQKSVADEFNAALNTLKEEAGLIPKDSAQNDASAQKPGTSDGPEASEDSEAAGTAAPEGSKEAAEGDKKEKKESSED